MLVHVADQPEVARGEGPVGLILAPTRELAHQIYQETKKYGKGYGMTYAPSGSFFFCPFPFHTLSLSLL